MRIERLAVSLACAALWASGQAGFSGPVSGLLFDAPSRAIRVVTGIPGAAYLGVAVVPDIEAAWIAPNGQSALVERGGAWHLVSQLSAAEPGWKVIEGLTARPVAVAWQADSAGLAVATATREVLVLGIEPAGEQVRSLDGVFGEVNSIALTGGALLVAVREEAGGAIYRASDEGGWTLAANTRGAAVLAPAADGAVFALDTSDGGVLALRGGTVELLAVRQQEGAVALGVSRDGARLLLARGGDEARIEVWDLASQAELERVALDAAPAGLERLAGGSLLLVTGRGKSGDVITVLAESGTGFSAFFVPVGE